MWSRGKETDCPLCPHLGSAANNPRAVIKDQDLADDIHEKNETVPSFDVVIFWPY